MCSPLHGTLLFYTTPYKIFDGPPSDTEYAWATDQRDYTKKYQGQSRAKVIHGFFGALKATRILIHVSAAEVLVFQ